MDVTLSNKVAFDSGCSDRQENVFIRPNSSRDFTIYDCGLMSTGRASAIIRVRENGNLTSLRKSVSITATAPKVSFAASSYSVNEGSSREITVEISSARKGDVTIPVTLSRGTAESGDYSVSSGLRNGGLVFSRGDTTKKFTIRSRHDSRDCSDETLTLGFGTLPSPFVNGTTSSSTFTINDDDTCVSFSSSSYSVSEGAGKSVTVRVSGARSGSLTIPISVSNVTAESSDYSVSGLGNNGDLTFAQSVSSKSFTISAKHDSECSDEYLIIRFGNNLPSGVTKISPFLPSFRMVDDDACVKFSHSAYSLNEGENRDITVLVSGARSGVLTIPISVSSGTAENSDYIVSGLSGDSLVFPVNHWFKRFTIESSEDDDSDDETVNLAFGSSLSGVLKLSPSTSTVTINDDDPEPTPTPTPTPTPEPTPKPVTVKISGGSGSVSRAENGTSVATYSATVSNGRSATWSLPATNHAKDKAKFNISQNGGVLRFLNAPDFENPTDSDTNNEYKVTVKAAHGDASASLNVIVTVTDMNEGPTISGSGSHTYQENGTAAVATYSAEDPEGDPITKWELPDTTHETDSSQFSISNGVLSFRSSPNYEDPSDSNDDNVYKVTVRAISSGGSDEINVTVTVTNVLEPPNNLRVSVNSSDGDRVDATYSGNETLPYYQFEIHRATSRSGSYSLETTKNDNNGSPVSFDGLTKGYWYKVQGRSCKTKTSTGTGCGDWSNFSAPVLLPVVVTISSSQAWVSEGNPIRFTVRANPAPQSALTVNLEVKDGAVKYIDGTLPKSVSIARNSASATFTINTSDDGDNKSNGSVTAKIKSGNGYKIGVSNSDAVVVRDNEPGAPTTLNVTRGNQKLTVGWTAPTDTGYKTLTGYIVNYRRTTTPRPSWSNPSSTLIAVASSEIRNLTRGNEYEIRVKACNNSGGSRCGPWSSLATGTPPTTPGGISHASILTGGQKTLSVDWNTPSPGGAAINEYQVVHKKTADANWSSPLSVTPTSGMQLQTEVGITGLEDSTSYHVKVRACNIGGCNAWPLDSAAAIGYTALAIPTDLDVRPMPLRKAMLAWTGDSDAAKYIVEVRPVGGMWGLPITNEPSSGDVLNAYHEIVLDQIIGTKYEVTFLDGTKGILYDYVGLADDDYEFRVKATGGGTFPDSQLSEIVKVVENPIVRANGDSRNAPTGEGQAEFTWTRMSNVSNGRYTVRARKLSPEGHHRVEWGGAIGYDESVPAIGCISEPQPCLSLPDRFATDRFPRGRVGARLSFTRNKLELGELYGVQLSYKTAANQSVIHVFSANDVYVWPSTSFPGGRESAENRDIPDRVATQPFFGYHDDRDYAYRVCVDTFFPDDPQRQSDWVNLIEHAFERWEIASDGFVTMTPEYSNPATKTYKDCTDTSPMRLMFHRFGLNPIHRQFPILPIRAEDDDRSEVRMVDYDGFATFIASVEVKSDPFKLCIVSGSACATSRTDYSDDNRGANNPLAGVDVTFKRNAFEDKGVDADDGKDHNYPRIPSGIRFNTCFDDQYPDLSNLNPDLGYFAYTTAVHEAGHALGLSDVTEDWKYFVSVIPFVDPFASDIYEASHSSIPDSVMNYDSEIFENYDKLTEMWKRHEPDCSPHPFDIAALYALYQTRNP